MARTYLKLSLILIILISNNALAEITSLDIAKNITQSYGKYNATKLIGVCGWWRKYHITTSAELDQYLPDLIVTVSNQEDDNPWVEARAFDKFTAPIGQKLMEKLTGFEQGTGSIKASSRRQSHSAIVKKNVDVFGSPLSLIRLSSIQLRYDTSAMLPYYSSLTDTLGTLGLAEMSEIRSYTPTNYIGQSFINHWGFEFPRNMSVMATNDYKASLILAQRAADLVTNSHTLHVAKGTANTCGRNCAVSNVIEELNEKNSKWQMVYPFNRHIHIGEDDSNLSGNQSLGADATNQGNGNYVFVVWRHYRGCIQKHGKFVYATRHVSQTHKR